MKALHFGAGNIGRGFIGKLLSDSGIFVTFADVNQEIIDNINQYKQYNVNIVGENNRVEVVKEIEAINVKDDEQVIHKLSDVDLITTAVGVNILNILAPLIAKGLIKRFKCMNFKPLNIIACENMVGGSSYLKHKIYEHLDSFAQQQAEQYVGFVDSAVDRIVPPVETQYSDSLQVTVEEFCEWIVDKTQFKGKIPDIRGMELTSNLLAFVERKLFTLNTGHLVCAYLGKRAGVKLIKDAIAIPEIRAFVKSTMEESGEVLIAKYGFDRDTHQAYILKILKRFANPYLNDEVTRVGREPIRKLGVNDRLVKPLLGTLDFNLTHTHLVKSIVMALKYENVEDPQSVELAEFVKKNGVETAIRHYTQITDEDTIKEILDAYTMIN